MLINGNNVRIQEQLSSLLLKIIEFHNSNPLYNRYGMRVVAYVCRGMGIDNAPEYYAHNEPSIEDDLSQLMGDLKMGDLKTGDLKIDTTIRGKPKRKSSKVKSSKRRISKLKINKVKRKSKRMNL